MGDLVYVGSCAGTFYALDRRRGEVVWSYDTRADGPKAQFHGDPLLAGDLLLTGSDAEPEAHLYAFDRRTGKTRWKTRVPGGVPFDVVAGSGRGFAVGMRGEAFSFDLETGERLWTFADSSSGGPRPPGHPALAGGRLFVATRTGAVFALDAESGRLLWSRDFGQQLNTSLLVSGGVLHVGSVEGSLFSLDTETGDVNRSVAAGGPLFGTPVRAGGCVMALMAPATIACLDPERGEIRWKRTTSKGWSSHRPLVLGGLVVVGNENGQVVGFDVRDGRQYWQITVPGVVRGLGAADGVLYVGTLGGKVVAVPLPGTKRD